MSDPVRTGGVGKNPAIEKINQLSIISSRMQAATQLEKRAFDSENRKVRQQIERRKNIIKEFNINFKAKKGHEG